MKNLTLLSLVGITSMALAHIAAGRGGGGGHGGGGFGDGGFGGGHFGGGGGFRGGGFGAAAHMSPGARFSFGARPVYGRPVYARSSSRAIAPSARATTAPNRQQGRGIAMAIAPGKHHARRLRGQRTNDQRARAVTSLRAMTIIGSVVGIAAARITGMATGGAMTGTPG
jgi:hypothetical protein